MATNSILRCVTIREKGLAKSFVNALENAQNKKSKKITIQKAVKELTKDQIKEIFG